MDSLTVHKLIFDIREFECQVVHLPLTKIKKDLHYHDSKIDLASKCVSRIFRRGVREERKLGHKD